nr:hypothetical protein [Tanacetum cinerariifolium]
MAQPVQNINHLAFRLMFERDKLFGNNFNDWFCQLKLVLRVEKKMFVIEQPLPAALAADSNAQVLAEWNALYDAYNEVACLMLSSMTLELHRQFENYSPYEMLQELKSMFEKQARVERFDLIQTFHACKQEDVGLILNGLTKDFAGFVRNYNMHNMGRTIGGVHVMLIEYEKGLPKKAETPQVMMIKGGKIQKSKKKLLKAKGKGKANGKGNDKQVIPKPKNPKPSAKEHPAKDDTCHHCKELGHWKRICPIYLAELLKKKKHVSRQGASYFITLPDDYSRYGYVYLLKHRHEEKSYFVGHVSIYDESYNSAVILLGLHSRICNTNLNMVPTKKVDKTLYELLHRNVPNLSYLKVWGCEALVKQDTPDKLQQISVKCIFIRYPKETMGYYFYFPPENKIVATRYAEFFEKNIITQEVSGRAIDLEEIQYEDTSPSEITSEISMEVEGFASPQEEVILIRRSIYGLKQASRSWNKRFDEEIKKFGFAQNLDEPCVYQKASGSNVTFLILYVDDIIIMGNHIPSLQSVKDYLGKCFAMKDLEEATFIFGIKIYRDRDDQAAPPLSTILKHGYAIDRGGKKVFCVAFSARVPIDVQVSSHLEIHKLVCGDGQWFNLLLWGYHFDFLGEEMCTWMVVNEIEDGLLEEMELSHVGKEKFGWWFEQYIDGKSEDDNEKKLMMMNEEG